MTVSPLASFCRRIPSLAAAGPADGSSPRMQMYLWSGEDSRSLTVTPPGSSLATGGAAFGPQSFSVTAQVVLGNDGHRRALDLELRAADDVDLLLPDC